MSKKTTLELLEDNLNKHMAICDFKRKIKSLKAENERLRKAGDLLERALILRTYKEDLHPSIVGWDAAKEGRDAK